MSPFKNSLSIAFRASLAALATALATFPASAQSNSVWDGGINGAGTSWFTPDNWADDTSPLSDAATTILINNRNSTGNITGPLSISSTRTVGTITISNINTRLPATLVIEANGNSTTDRTLTLHGGITLADTTTTVAFRSFTGNATSGNLTLALAAPNTFNVSGGGQLQMLDNVLVTGNSSIEKTGPGTLLMGIGKTFSGGFILTEGRVRTNGSSVQSSGNITGGPFGNGTLTLRSGILQPFGTFARTYHNSVLLDGDIALGGLALDGVTLTANQTFSPLGGGSTTVTGNRTLDIQSLVIWNQDITGNSSLTKTGSASLTLAGTNSFTGGLNISQGIVSVNAATTLGSSVSVNTSAVVINGGTLKFTAAPARSGSNRGLRVGSSNGTIDVDVGVEARIQGSFRDFNAQTGVLRKIGAGTLALEGGTHSFTGGTQLQVGTLRLNGNTLGNVTGSGLSVSSGAALEGYGIINGNSSFADGSTIRLATYETSNSTVVPNPTTSAIGSFTFNNNLTLGNTSLAYDLDTPAASDRITVASGGVLDLGTGVLDLSDFTFTAGTNFASGTYPLITTSSPIVGTLGSSLTGTLSGLNTTLGISPDGFSLQLIVTSSAVAPVFTINPVSQTVTAGGNVTFTVSVTGTPTPTLQWFQGANPLSGQTAATLNLSNVQLSAAGSYSCVATNAAAPSGVSSSTATLTVNPALTPFQSWIAGFPGVGGLTGFNDDFDKDGLSNLQEYAFGGDPTLSSTAPLPFVGTAAGPVLTLTFNKAAGGNVTYTIEKSTNLTAAWGNATGSTSGTAPAVYTDDTTLGSSSRVFLRVRVSQ